MAGGGEAATAGAGVPAASGVNSDSVGVGAVVVTTGSGLAGSGVLATGVSEFAELFPESGSAAWEAGAGSGFEGTNTIGSRGGSGSADALRSIPAFPSRSGSRSAAGNTPVAAQTAAVPAVPAQMAASFAIAAMPAPREPPVATMDWKPDSEPRPKPGNRV